MKRFFALSDQFGGSEILGSGDSLEAALASAKNKPNCQVASVRELNDTEASKISMLRDGEAAAACHIYGLEVWFHNSYPGRTQF